MNIHRFIVTAVFICLAALGAERAHADEAKPATVKANGKIKVFLLVGQSNMQGKGSLEHLDQLVKSEPAKFGHLKKDGKWIEREDVQIIFPSLDRKNDQKGNLSVGYTWPPRARIGPELSFGEAMGDRYEDPVLLVKSCWGGQSLDIDFRSPSAGWDRAWDIKNRDQWKPGSQGWAYKEILNNQHFVFSDLGAHFPQHKGKEYEIVGLVWFQGWNDLINGARIDAYEKNLVHFIRDIRKDLGTPHLPIVIGVMGQDGDKAADNMKKMRAAQSAPAAMEEFKGTVAAVPTAPYWDPSVKYDGGYHYMGSARFYYEAGAAMGKAMAELRDAAENQGKATGNKQPDSRANTTPSN